MELLEIEVKFYCSDPDKMRTALLGAGAVSAGKVFERNVLYDRNGELASQKRVLRLRQDARCTLTYKEPAPGTDPGFKIMKELEIMVDDFQRSEQILESLGFLSSRKYEKWRETFHLGKTVLLLDAMPFGTFLELEGAKQDIIAISRGLGLAWEKRIVLNYMEIFEIIRRGEGVASMDLTFQAFENMAVSMEKHLPQMEKGRA